MSGISGRGGDGLGLAQYFPRLLLNGYAPQVHAPASVAGKVEILPVRRPGRVEAEIRQSLNTLARRSHHEDASALPLGAEGDAFAVWGEGRLRVVRRGVLRQVNRILPAHTLQVDVPVSRQIAGVD